MKVILPPNGYCAMGVLSLEEYSKLTDGAEKAMDVPGSGDLPHQQDRFHGRVDRDAKGRG